MAAAARWLGVVQEEVGELERFGHITERCTIQYLGALDLGTLVGTSVIDSLNESYYRVLRRDRINRTVQYMFRFP